MAQEWRGAVTVALLLLACCRAVSWGGGAVPFAPPSAQWMYLSQADIANLTLSELVVPGTHDTGTYTLSDQPGPGVPLWVDELLLTLKSLGVEEPFTVIRNWANTQISPVFQQLYSGARFLDVRVCWDSGSSTFRTLHFIMGDKTENMLADMAQFLSYFPEEVLILQWGDFGAFNDTHHDNLMTLIQRYLGPYGLFPKSLAASLAHERKDGVQVKAPMQGSAGIESRGSGSRAGTNLNTPEFSFTYSDMIHFGKRVILLYDDAPTSERYDVLWPSDAYLVSDWANVDNFPAMVSYENNSVSTHTGNPNAVYKLQWVLTASARLIVDAVLNPWDTVPTLHALSRTANGNNFDNFIKQTINYRINLLMTDFLDEVNSLDWARVINRLGCNDAKAYRQTTCRAWKQAGQCANLTVQALCPLTCNACNWTKITGKPGDKCAEGNQCMLGLCNTEIGMCLTDYPALSGQTCGVNSQCWSGSCANYVCTGTPLYGRCSKDAECGSLSCMPAHPGYQFPAKVKSPNETFPEVRGQVDTSTRHLDAQLYNSINKIEYQALRHKLWLKQALEESKEVVNLILCGYPALPMTNKIKAIIAVRGSLEDTATLEQYDLCVNAILPFSTYTWKHIEERCDREDEVTVVTTPQQRLCGLRA